MRRLIQGTYAPAIAGRPLKMEYDSFKRSFVLDYVATVKARFRGFRTQSLQMRRCQRGSKKGVFKFKPCSRLFKQPVINNQ